MIRKNLEYGVRIAVNGHLDSCNVLLPSPCDRVRTLGDFFNENGRNADLSLAHLVRTQPPVAPWDYHEALIDISAARFKKSDYSPAFLRNLGETRIREHEGEFMHTNLDM